MTVLYDKRDRMAFVTLNRPEAKNAVDPGMHDELCRIWADFNEDGDGGITRLVNTCGVGVAMQLVPTAEPIDAERALQCNLVTKVVPHDQLLEETELMARQILRNSQRAVRSAKETILEVVGKPIDDQLRIEGWNSYTCVDREEAAALLRQFDDKVDAGRAGSNATEL